MQYRNSSGNKNSEVVNKRIEQYQIRNAMLSFKKLNNMTTIHRLINKIIKEYMHSCSDV